jgi:subtilisin family serine protease
MRRPPILVVALALAVTGLVSIPAQAQAQARTQAQVIAAAANPVPDSYIVVFKDTPNLRVKGVPQRSAELAAQQGGQLRHVYQRALRGFSVQATAEQAARIAASPDVAYVEQDQVVQLDTDQVNPPSWGLDRIDQRNLPLNNLYSYATTATNVHAYIIDTGILTTHTDFGGRASSGFDFVDNDSNATDCNGHGTHVSGTVGGSTYGVAKGVSLVGVRVLNCSGSGTNAGVIAGIDWVTANAIKPAVANMSLGGSASTAVDTAVTNSINSGVVYGIAAGNSNANACNFSPARTPAAITVGATTITDARASFSNFGTCLDIFAPGQDITSDWFSSTTATNTISGTSMATPHVVGAAALYLATHPTATPAQVRDALVAAGTTGVVAGAGTGSPNVLLFTGSAPTGTTVYSDTFETATGWTTNPSGTNTAITGQWERANPEDTNSSGPKQLGTTVSGSFDLVTAGAAGSSAGVNDIDGGVTSIQSPAITLPASGTLTLSFSWYLAHGSNATSDDFFRVSVNGSQVFQQLGAAVNRDGAWGTASVNVSGFAGQTVRILISAADAGTASLVEAGVDNVTVTQS